MTVWIVNPFDNLPTEGFRPQRYWLMAEAFARAGHRVVYWTSDFNHGTKERRREKIGGESRWGEEFEVVRIPTRPYRKNVCLARILSHRRLARDFERMATVRLSTFALGPSPSALRPSPFALRPPPLDLIIASTPPLGLCDAARRVAKRVGAKFVCDIQDAWPETFARLLPRGFKWLGTVLFVPMRRVARRLYREADLVTGVSARYADLSGRDDFHLAYHGIAESRSPVDAESLPRPVDAKSVRVHRLVYVGNLGEGYDLGTVIEAVARRDGLTLDIAGRGPRESALRARVAARGLDGRVRFHGYLDAAALDALLARCDVGVIPMRDDAWVGFPYKLCDYLKAGLPVVSSLAGECGELLERTGFGRVYVRGDPASLLRALDALPCVPVSLPPELRAEEIYSRYVEKASSLVPHANPSCHASRVPCPQHAGFPMKLSVLVPSLDGSVPPGLRNQVAGRDDTELVVVTGVSPVGKARNEALRRATGEYVAWVDGDDEVADGWLDGIMAALADGPDVVTIDAEPVGWEGRGDFIWGVAARDATIDRLREDVYRDLHRTSSLWLYVTRRSLWDGLAFDETVRVAEDYLLLPQVLLRAKSCRYLSKRLYRYVRTETGLTATQSAALDSSVIDLWERRWTECPRASSGPCGWGLAVSAYWTCCRAAISPMPSDAARHANVDRCRALIRRLWPVLAREALVARSLSVRDRISWTIRFLTAALDVWTLQRLRHRRCRA